MFSGEKRGNSDRVSFLGSNFVRASIFTVRYPCPIGPQGTKPILDVRSEFPRFSSENIAANMPMVDFLRQFSEKKNATPVQISLAWLLARKPFIVPIPGTRSVDHLNENLRAIDVQLTPADLREIETALSKIEVYGGRMNEERMKVVDQTG